MSNDKGGMWEGWAGSMAESADVGGNVGNGCVSCDTFVVMSDSTDNREVWLRYELFYSMMMIFFRLFLERIQIDLREKFKKLCISQPRLTNREKN